MTLSSLRNIRTIKWKGNYSNIFHIAGIQLSSILSPCKITEISLIAQEEGYEKVDHHCKLIDEVLTGDNFPFPQRVQLLKDIPFDYFPTLQSEGLLEAVRYKILFVSLFITLTLFVHSW